MKIYILTSNFPYGKGETFLSEEVRKLEKEHELVFISRSNANQSNPIRANSIKERHTVINIPSRSTLRRKLLPIFIVGIQNIPKVFRILFLEIKDQLLVSKKIKLNAFQALLKSMELAFDIRKIISTDSEKEVVLYSYWYANGVLSFAFVNNENVKLKISRAHRGDLYERKGEVSQTFHTSKYHYLDKVIFISNHGIKYWKELYPKLTQKCFVHKLITPEVDYNIDFFKKKTREPTELISVSNLIGIKRVELIIEALSLITDVNIVWKHYGSGELFDEMKSLAGTLLSDKTNIEYHFMGHVRNSDLLLKLKNDPPYCLLHTSESEGLPISMVEAASFGIPIIACDVGGVSEIVSSENGILLPESVSSKEVSLAVVQMCKLSDSSYLEKSESSRKKWNSNHRTLEKEMFLKPNEKGT